MTLLLCCVSCSAGIYVCPTISSEAKRAAIDQKRSELPKATPRGAVSGNDKRKSSDVPGTSASVSTFHALKPVMSCPTSSCSRISSGEDCGPFAFDGKRNVSASSSALCASKLPASSPSDSRNALYGNVNGCVC